MGLLGPKADANRLEQLFGLLLKVLHDSLIGIGRRLFDGLSNALLFGEPVRVLHSLRNFLPDLS